MSGTAFRRCLPILVLLAADAPAEPIGRLFHTPAQRAALDQARKAGIPVVGGETVTVHGSVARRVTYGTVWINGASRDETAPGDGHRIAIDRRDATLVNIADAGDEPLQLRVGDTFDRRSGSRHDLLPAGSIVVGKRRRSSATE